MTLADQTLPVMHEVSVDATHEIIRLDKFIASQFPHFSRTYIQHLIDNQCVNVNGQCARKPSQMVKAHDSIQLTVPEIKARASAIGTQDLGIKILFTHEHFFIIDKPAGLLVHPTSTYCRDTTLVDWLISTFPELQGIGPSDRTAIVHRLDRETSGLMIIPRSNYAHQIFGALFKSRTIHKTYHAIVCGHLDKQGMITAAIGRDMVHRKKMSAYEQQDYISNVNDLQKRGSVKKRNATTYYTAIEYFKEHCLVALKPITGRTHQIRVHMKHLQHPLLGDSLYGTSSTFIARHALHASALSFTFDGQPFEFVSEFPADFQNALTQLRTY